MIMKPYDIKKNLELCLKCHQDRGNVFRTSFNPKASRFSDDYVKWGNEPVAVPPEFSCAGISFFHDHSPEIRQFLATLWPVERFFGKDWPYGYEERIVEAIEKTWRAYRLQCSFEIVEERCPYFLEHVILCEDENRYARILKNE